MAERKKKQAAAFVKDESAFVKGSSVKGADTTHKAKEKHSGTNQPRDENIASGHDVQKQVQSETFGQDVPEVRTEIKAQTKSTQTGREVPERGRLWTE